MAPEKVRITDESGKVLREGSPRQSDFSQATGWKKWITPDTIIRVLIFGAMLLGFAWRTNNTVFLYITKTDRRIEIAEKRQDDAEKRTAEISAALLEVSRSFGNFRNNSDGYHSSVLGTQFENGKPLNSGFDTKRVRDLLTQ